MVRLVTLDMDVDDAGIGFIVILPGSNHEVMKRIFDQDSDDFTLNY